MEGGPSTGQRKEHCVQGRCTLLSGRGSELKNISCLCTHRTLQRQTAAQPRDAAPHSTGSSLRET